MSHESFQKVSVNTRELHSVNELDETSFARYDKMIRVYRSDPNHISLQLRTLGPISGNKGAKDRRFITTVDYMTADQLREHIKNCTDALIELEERQSRTGSTA